MKYNVFISYSRKDTSIANDICNALENARITYFIDRQGIGGGMEFPKILASAIEESDVFLFLASNNSYNSPFTDREVTYAFNKKRGEKMLLYNIDGSVLPPHLELIFSSNNWRSLKENPIIPDLINDIKMLIELSETHVNRGAFTTSDEIINDFESEESNAEGFINSFEEMNLSLDAERWYKRGCDIYYSKIEGETTDAVRCFFKAANMGHVQAQLFLSKLYFLGIGVKEDNELAYYWMKQAASSNGIAELDKVANYAFRKGEYKEAYEFYKKIIDLYVDVFRQRVMNGAYHIVNPEHPVINAICRIGLMYEKGYLGVVDYTNAKSWYKLAKDIGYPTPLKELLDKTKAEVSRSIAEDLPDLLSNEEKYELAKRYLDGNGLPVSYEKAIVLLKECSDNGNYHAMKDLAFCYLQGKGCILDEAKAYALFEKVANVNGDAQALFETALLLEVGRGVKKDFIRAIMMFVDLALRENSDSVKHLATLYKYGKLTGRRDVEKERVCEAYYSLLINHDHGIDFYEHIFYINGWGGTLFPDVIDCFRNSRLERFVERDSFDLHNILAISHYYQEELKDVIASLKESRKNRFIKLLKELNTKQYVENYIIDEKHKNIKTIDLGLPSGLLWADMNVGADDNNPNGLLYAWAESETKKVFNWNTYFDKKKKGRFEYINVNGTTTWNQTMDCAWVYFGEGWTVPKEEHIKELLDYCSWKWVDKDNSQGYLVRGKNGNSIFLPVSYKKDNYGAYWAYTLNDEESSKYADCLFFDKNGYKVTAAQRCLGLMVRPVAAITVYGKAIATGWMGYSIKHRLK